MSRLIDKATQFARAVEGGDLDSAYGMLSGALAERTSASDLDERFGAMAEEMGGVTAIGEAQVILEDWPGRDPDEVAIVCVPLLGRTYSEAVTVTLADVYGELRISDIEWGRP